MKKCALFSLVLFTPPVLKKKKKEKEVLKNLQKKRLKNKREREREREHQQHHQKTRTEERRESERARARESDGRTEEVLSFFFRARGRLIHRVFKTRFINKENEKTSGFVSVFDYNTQSARDVHIHR